MATAKTHAIAELMQKLKAGDISKAELFMQLSKLQPTGGGGGGPEPPAPTVPFKRSGTSFAASVVESNERGAGGMSSLRPQHHSLYDTDRAGVSHDQAKLISVQQLLASRLAAEKAHQLQHTMLPPDETRQAAAPAPSAAFVATDPFAYSPMQESPTFDGRSSQPNDYDGGASRYVHYLDEDSFHVRVSRWKQQKESLKEKNEGSRPTSAGSVGDGRDRNRRFRAFVRRQAAQESDRQRKIDAARETHTFDFKPAINKKSSEIMQQGRKGDFIERVAKYALRKEHDKLKKKSIKLQVFYARNSHTMCGQDPQCTFKPKINNVSANRVARSVTELSRGDLLKRETTQRLLKLRVSVENGRYHEMAQLTFKPSVNSTSIPHVESKLKVVSNPDTYVQVRVIVYILSVNDVARSRSVFKNTR
ncbi:hypothetical protein DYB36_005064 [Aphanomyces astaci]|uniref:Uncharacterized protein n=1 Tax=Aphanomyces astaci TaxID=112090 RepID=A0A397B1V7_APHAT|nr:hypothetical protein DYB36_005064 [Aphanomyces astaci]